MTAKNRIILSVIAIITTLVVAGSMIFIIFAATNGYLTGGVTIQYNTNYQLRGIVSTRYTTQPLVNGFASGEGDQLIKTEDGADYIEFKGWEDTDGTTKNLESIDLQLTVENPWVIFEMHCDFYSDDFLGAFATYDANLTTGSTMNNVEVVWFGLAGGGRISDISPETLEAYEEWDSYHQSCITWTEKTLNPSFYSSCNGYSYYMIRVIKKSQEASFNGGLEFIFGIDY